MNKGIKAKLYEAVEKCDTQREAAAFLGASEQYVYLLTKQLGITKWRQKNREHTKIKSQTFICEDCGNSFSALIINNNPHRFCNKKCQGRWLGKNHGFKKKK